MPSQLLGALEGAGLLGSVTPGDKDKGQGRELVSDSERGNAITLTVTEGRLTCQHNVCTFTCERVCNTLTRSRGCPTAPAFLRVYLTHTHTSSSDCVTFCRSGA